MPTQEELAQHRQALQNMRSLEQKADQTLLTYPAQAQVLYQQLYEQTNALLVVQDFGFLFDLFKFRIHICWGIGHAADMQGNHDVAIEAFNRALLQFIPPPYVGYIAPLEGLGRTYLQLGQSDNAKTYYKRAYDQAFALRYWNDAVRTRFQIALCDYNLGERDLFLLEIKEARELADRGMQELQQRKQEIETHESVSLTTDDPTGETLHQFKDQQFGTKEKSTQNLVTQFCQVVDQTIQQSKYSQASKYLLDANTRIKKLAEDLITRLGLVANQLVQQGEYENAEQRLDDADTLAQANSLLQSQWGIRLEQADMYSEQEGCLPKAIDCAMNAVKIARSLSKKPLLETALHKLIYLHYSTGNAEQISTADEELAELKSLGNMTTVATLVAMRVILYYQQGQYKEALQAIENVEKEDIELEVLRRLLRGKGNILRLLGRREEALQANLQTIKLYNQSLETSANLTISNWGDMLRELGLLYGNTALITSELGRLRESLEWADKAKAQILRTQLVQAGYTESDAYKELDAITFPDLQALLDDDRAAIAIYVLGPSSSVYVYNAAQKAAEPQRIPLTFSVQDLQNILPPPKPTGEGYRYTENPFARLLPQLSAWLLHPLREVVNNCSVLCIVPDPLMASIPFAALECEDAEGVRHPLIKYCATAFTPAVAVLQWCRQRRVEYAQHPCLALGVGDDSEGSQLIKFSSQAEEVAALFQSNQLENCALPESTTAHDFLEQAQHYPIIHLACHGGVDKSEPDTLLASQLIFSDKPVTAKDIFASHLEATLVFLNACLSGDFILHPAREIGGFWQAFLHAGTSSLIATQIEVHPDHAQQVAIAFYREWLKGSVTKAEALRQAQLRMREQEVETVHWSHHILIGDYR